MARRSPLDSVSLSLGGMSGAQVMAESGGQQFDSKGKPLTSSAGAIGVAQMLEPTAKEQAKRSGIEWDPVRFRTDKDYNLRLGNEHMEFLTQRYGGDRTLATAAYHSGIGNVDEAVARFGRANFTQGLGPQGRAYVAKLSKEGAAPVAQKPNASPLDAVTASLGGQFDVVNPTTAGPAIGAASQQVVDRVGSADVMLQGAIDAINGVQEERKAALTSTVQAKQEVNAARLAQTNELIQAASPLLQRRVDIADRKAQLRRMDPFTRLFKGLTDSKFNEVMIDEEETSNEERLRALSGNYDVMRKLYGDAIENIQATYATDDSLRQLEEANISQDLQLAGQSIQLASQGASSLLNQLQTQSAVDAAQNAARDNILVNMSEQQINGALEQARNNGGIAIVNGVQIPESRLTELSMNWENKRLSLDGMRLGNQTQNLAFRDAMETRLIRSLSPEERKAALASGGKYQGQQLDMGKLAVGVQQDEEIAQMRNNSILQEGLPQQFESQAKLLSDGVKASNALTRQLLGFIPQPMQSFYAEVASETAFVQAAIAKADAEGTGTQMRAQLLPRLAKLRERQVELLDQAAEDWAGGNKTLGRVAKAWLSGRPLAAQESVGGLVSMARGGLPAGTTMSPAASAIFTQVQAQVKEWDSKHVGGKPDDKGLMMAIGQTLKNSYNDAMLDDVLRNTPTMARQVTDSQGRMHPFSRINPNDFMAAIQGGDAAGLDAVASAYGVTAQELGQVISGSPAGGAILQRIRQSDSKRANVTSAQLGREVLSAQTSQTLTILDANFTTDNFRPSAAFVDLLNNPEYQRKVSSRVNKGRGGTFADFLVQTAAGPGFDTQFGIYINTAAGAERSTRVAALKNRADAANDMVSNPMRRTQFILGAIDGVSQNEEKLLIQYLAQNVKGFNQTGHSPSGILANTLIPNSVLDATSGTGATMDAVTAIILGGKIADPTLESIRKRVAKEWVVVDKYLTHGMSRLGGK